MLCQEEEAALSDAHYLPALWLGATLPTDDIVSAYSVIGDLVARLQERGVEVDVPPAELELPDLENKRHELEAQLLQLEEKEYADSQADRIDEIVALDRSDPLERNQKAIKQRDDLYPQRGSPRLP